jgi:hypothetical protein
MESIINLFCRKQVDQIISAIELADDIEIWDLYEDELYVSLDFHLPWEEKDDDNARCYRLPEGHHPKSFTSEMGDEVRNFIENYLKEKGIEEYVLFKDFHIENHLKYTGPKVEIKSVDFYLPKKFTTLVQVAYERKRELLFKFNKIISI